MEDTVGHGAAVNAVFVFFRKPRGKDNIIHVFIRRNLSCNNFPHKKRLKDFLCEGKSMSTSILMLVMFKSPLPFFLELYQEVYSISLFPYTAP